jgi:hemoglobin-like flavoprotein
MTTQHTALIRAGWNELGSQAPAFAACFYDTLFMLDPTLKALFKGDMALQHHKLVGMLGSAIDLLDRPDQLLPALRSLGGRHGKYGVQDAHYAVVGQALLDTLAETLGDRFTPATRAAWTETYGFIAKVMMESARTPKPVPVPLPMLVPTAAAIPVRRISAMLAMALVMGGSAAMPVEAQPKRAGHANGEHPAVLVARTADHRGIDPNTFIVGHGASPTTRGLLPSEAYPSTRFAHDAGQSSVEPTRAATAQ